MKIGHQHRYDDNGNQLCCTPEEEKINKKANRMNGVENDGCCTPKHVKKKEEHHDDDVDDHSHYNANKTTFKMFLPSIISLCLLLMAYLHYQ